MVKVSEKIIKIIEKNNICPRTRRYFIIMNYLRWLLCIFLAVLASLIFSIILFSLLDQNWQEYKYLGSSFIRLILISAPYIWITVGVFILISVYYSVRNTNRGYRFGICRLVSCSVILSIFLGAIMFLVGLSSEVHEHLLHGNRFMDIKHHDDWNYPHNGLISGDIIKIGDERDFDVRDLNGFTWRIKMASSVSSSQGFAPEVGENVRLIGHMDGDDSFVADFIRALEAR